MVNRALPLFRTKPISPSKLGIFAACPLSYLLETEKPVGGGLSSTPIALRGTISHKLIERFTGNPLPTPQELLDAFQILLTEALAKADASALLRLAFQARGSAGVLSSAQVISACGFVMKILKSQPQSPRDTFLSPVGRETANFIGPEKKFEDEALDLAGYIDLTYVDTEGEIHVVDYKTGRVLAEDGGPRSEYLTQIAAYGLLVKRKLSLSTIFLNLTGSNSVWEGELNPDLEATVLQLVNGVHRVFPRGEEINPRQLAISGGHCQSCNFRPSCDVYIDFLRTSHYGDERRSLNDVSGQIVEIKPSGRLATLRLSTISGNISIAGVPTDLMQGVSLGKLVDAYGLGYFDDLTRARFPANFFVYREDNPSASAFGARLKFDSR